MATTNYREDFLGRNLASPTTTARDFLGRLTTATVDYTGRALRRILRANSTAVTLGQELQLADGEKFVVTVAGTTDAAPPEPPAVGETVEDGTATLRRTA